MNVSMRLRIYVDIYVCVFACMKLRTYTLIYVKNLHTRPTIINAKIT